ncbi:DUF742 domain-containing protein [Streptomyces griseoflavus]|uniref:DUF742 domain-containing protein n=1 Tax=Streptomyces griseoflavus Tu4000 TaxID=467200 RepID=D9Y0U0_9ACTN|nr:DUF742 domain-containing protein [Streptomyces griseoflavus]EFL37238.1 conserved hypothetical protein [Streptomyces griseoflavus Tu4000]
MTGLGRAAEESTFVRTYTLTRGRTKPRYLLGLDTVLEAGSGRPGPAQAEECAEILALCRAHRRSVTELAGRLGRPVTAVKVLVSDLLDADALVVPVTAPYAASGSDSDAGPSTQLLAAVSAGLKRKFPNATRYPQAG